MVNKLVEALLTVKRLVVEEVALARMVTLPEDATKNLSCSLFCSCKMLPLPCWSIRNDMPVAVASVFICCVPSAFIWVISWPSLGPKTKVLLIISNEGFTRVKAWPRWITCPVPEPFDGDWFGAGAVGADGNDGTDEVATPSTVLSGDELESIVEVADIGDEVERAAKSAASGKATKE